VFKLSTAAVGLKVDTRVINAIACLSQQEAQLSQRNSASCLSGLQATWSRNSLNTADVVELDYRYLKSYGHWQRMPDAFLDDKVLPDIKYCWLFLFGYMWVMWLPIVSLVFSELTQHPDRPHRHTAATDGRPCSGLAREGRGRNTHGDNQHSRSGKKWRRHLINSKFENCCHAC